MEIASYKMLIEAAVYVGDTETQSVCEEILAEEKRWRLGPRNMPVR
jgi:ferritin-like metal-binding protein YciE